MAFIDSILCVRGTVVITGKNAIIENRSDLLCSRNRITFYKSIVFVVTLPALLSSSMAISALIISFSSKMTCCCPPLPPTLFVLLTECGSFLDKDWEWLCCETAGLAAAAATVTL